MDIFQLRNYCLSLPMSEEATPFDETTLVYRIGGKIFMMVDMVKSQTINVKCEPDIAEELRERYDEITPGWHMNKRHWNTIKVDGDLPEAFIKQQIENSYRLVLSALPRKQREELQKLIGSAMD